MSTWGCDGLVLCWTLCLDPLWAFGGGMYRWLADGKVERPTGDIGGRLAEGAVCESEGRLMNGGVEYEDEPEDM